MSKTSRPALFVDLRQPLGPLRRSQGGYERSGFGTAPGERRGAVGGKKPARGGHWFNAARVRHACDISAKQVRKLSGN